MPDDPNLFDDDSLFPDWLRGMEEKKPDDEADELGTDAPPWMQKPGEKPPAPTGNLPAPPWMQQQDNTPRPPTGPLEVLPWSTPQQESGAPAESDNDVLQWDDTSPKAPSGTRGEIPRGLTGALPWMDSEPGQSSVPEQFTMDDLLGDAEQPPAEEADWMSSFGQAASFDTDTPAADEDDWLAPAQSEPPQSEMPSWLDDSAFDTPDDEGSSYKASPETAASFDELDESTVEPIAPPSPPKPPSVIRRIRPTENLEPPPQPEQTEWLGTTESAFDDFGAANEPTGLSYEEWEQLQAEREHEAQKTPEERLMEEVPDWFDEVVPESGTPPSPPPAEKSGGPEFVPGWFLGLEDQNPEEAPDWFNKIDYSSGPLAEPAPPPVPAAPEPTPDDLPDWFKGIETPGVEGMDWEQAFGAPAAPEPQTPDWKAKISPRRAEEELPMPDMDALLSDTPESTDIPDWLAAAAPQASAVAQPEDIPFPDLDLDQVIPSQGADEGIEDWMLQFTPTETPAATPPRLSQREEEDFVERFDPLEAEPSTPAPIDEDAPDWLRDMAGDEPVAERESGAHTVREPAPLEDLDWLAGISADDMTFEPQAEAPREAPEPETHPTKPPSREEPAFDSRAIDQLLGLYTPSEPTPEPELTWPGEEVWPAAEVEAPAAQEGFEIFGVQDTAWNEDAADLAALLDDDDLDKTLPLPPERALEPDAPLPATQEFQPKWVGEIRPSDLPVTMKFGGIEVSVKQKQVFELPDRIRTFHDSSIQETPKPDAQPAPSSGPLAGIDGALPLIDIGLARDITAPTHGLVVTPEQQIRAARLQALVDVAAGEEEGEDEIDDMLEPGRFSFEDGAEPEIEIAPRLRRRSHFKADRLIISLLLFAGLIAPFITDALHFAADPPALGDRQLDVAAEIDQLAAGDYVLFAMEYGPTAAGELDALAEAVLRDTLSRGVIPLTLSTNAAGALHAEAVLAPLVEDERLLAARAQGEDALQAGEDYILLSFLSGEAVGVRSLNDIQEDSLLSSAFDNDLRGENTDLNIDDLQEDIALIVVVGEGTEDIRTWAEQLNDVDVPKVALVTASVEPLVTAYVNEDGYTGYLAGYRDTASYNTTRNANSREPYEVPDGIDFDLPNPETSRWHSMALGTGIAAALIVLGMVVNLFRGLLRRARR